MRRLTRRGLRLGVALAAVGGALLPSALPAPAATAAHLPSSSVTGRHLPAEAAADRPPVDLRVDEVAPGWVTGGHDVRLTASLTAADTEVTDLRVTLSTAAPLDSRKEVTAWLDAGGGERRREQVRSAGRLSIGASREVALDLTSPTVDRPRVLPVSVAVSGVVDGERRLLDVQRTVVPVLPEGGVDRTTARVGWAVGATAPLSAALLDEEDDERRAAWTRALDLSGSVAAATDLGDRVTPVVDPAVVPHLSGDRADALGTSRDGAWRLVRHAVDPLDVDPAREALWRHATAPQEGVERPLVLDLSSSSGRQGSDDPRLHRLVDATAEDTVVLAPSGFRGEDTASGRDAAADPGNWWRGHRVGWVDQASSHHLGEQESAPQGDAGGRALPGQALLGLTLLADETREAHGADPGQVPDLVLAPDPARVDAAALRHAVDLATSAPWLQSVPAAEMLACTRDCPTEAPEGTASWPAIEPRTPRPSPPAELPSVTGDAAALAEVVDRGPTDLLRDGPLAQLSTVWENEEQRQQSWTELHRTTDDLLRALDVEDSTVNLLADDAELRATVANSSTTSFHDLRVVVRPGNDRVTADQPEGSLGLGARGRASTSFTARTHAAGQVPVRILVTTPDGGRVLARGEVTVNARPATGWWYAGIGIVTALLIGFGAWRTVRQVRAGATPPPS
ncbi:MULTISPECIES: hypothetical protein [Kytococcus]|uniref:hypothetical protein n=1 Tax=Kytococcus TaxID=57499 RepID=UPI0008D56FB2|nr:MULTISPECIES: hypothetical protein [Kytococcus]OFS13715.1 hypothetical protein HMPREF3099_05565 [Kytococcus sp. HMSC28H12]